IFLGKEIATHRNFSEDTAEKIDIEISKIVKENYERAKSLLSESIDILHRLAQELLVKEVLNADELDTIVSGTATSDSTAQEDETGEQEAPTIEA
ncbi:MAG: cell division protein FtsH, partial [Deltaproteobacteria bacterium]|nr:cell division protein FtsH [Deltaproteobacteria bacterium]